jgi:hypothetical protein
MGLSVDNPTLVGATAVVPGAGIFPDANFIVELVPWRTRTLDVAPVVDTRV